jgi:membrane associated rhomboid family serine protease
MIPIKDSIPSSKPPYVNYAIIAITCLVFLWELSLGPYLPQVAELLGFVPHRFLTLLGQESQPRTLVALPLVTSLFLHAGWLHLIGNMWFLFVFGDNVEDVLGHARYLLFYLASGVGANFIYLMFSPFSSVPLVGASGAIAGVMGAYFTLFPGARVLTLFLIVFFPVFLELPAYFFLGLWFVLQFLLGSYASLGVVTAEGGVAWWAHVGGFLVGILLLCLLAPFRVRSLFRRGPNWG